MKASNLKEVNEIDSTIQVLLNELTSLYKQRSELFGGKVVKSVKSSKKTSLENIDLSSFDLTLKD